MTESEGDATEGEIVESEATEGAEVLDEVREAAGAVIASLKRFVEATERVVEDPAAFSQIIDNGRSVVEAFVGGFASHASRPADHEEEPTAHGEDIVPES